MDNKRHEQPSAENISRHYDRQDIESAIRNALERAGKDITQLTRSDLSGLDELHIGGKSATLALAKNSQLPAGGVVLDVGSGLGGPARTLAAEFGHNVIGLDITEGFCRLSRKLTSAVDMSAEVGFACGDALELPFKSDSFDGIWSQHCSMNIPDKKRLYSEYLRVLKKGGYLMVHDVVEGGGDTIRYPVPWASDPALSFLVSESETLSLLSAAGFTEVYMQEITEDALAWFEQQKNSPADRKKAIFNQKMVYGDDLLTMVRNMVINLKEGRMRILEAILIR